MSGFRRISGFGEGFWLRDFADGSDGAEQYGNSDFSGPIIVKDRRVSQRLPSATTDSYQVPTGRLNRATIGTRQGWSAINSVSVAAQERKSATLPILPSVGGITYNPQTLCLDFFPQKRPANHANCREWDCLIRIASGPTDRIRADSRDSRALNSDEYQIALGADFQPSSDYPSR